MREPAFGSPDKLLSAPEPLAFNNYSRDSCLVSIELLKIRNGICGKIIDDCHSFHFLNLGDFPM